MKNLIIAIFCVAFFVGLNGCKKEVIHPESGFIIEFGSECGWCAGTEFITITSSKIEYRKIITCGEDQGTETKNKSIESEKWDSVLSAVDFNLFKTLEYNECNVCADGCDEIIKITNCEETHEIRYTPGEEIEGVENLKVMLSEILSEFNEQD